MNETLTDFLQAEEQGEVVLPMATRPHYASILNEDWDPLDLVGRSLVQLLYSCKLSLFLSKNLPCAKTRLKAKNDLKLKISW